MTVESSLRQIVRQLDEFDRLLHLHGVRVERLSGWSVGNHVEHSVNVTESVLDRLTRSEEGSAPGKPLSMIGRIILLSGYIPRGRGRSPKGMLPSDASLESVRPRLASLRDSMRTHLAEPAKLMRSSARFPHPYFGILSPAQWVRFIQIHQHHHLKIVREIASSSLT